MTTTSTRWTPARFLLIAAALIAMSAIAYAVARQPAETPVPSAPATASAGDDPEQMIQQLQDIVGANPKDAEAWQKLGLAYFMSGRHGDAARAYHRAAGLAPENASYWSAFGEASVMASARDPMPPEALEAFRKAYALDATDPRARYFLAVARDLQGDHKGAIDDWLALLKDTPAGAPWLEDLKRTIEQVGKIHGIDVSSRISAVAPAPAAAAPTAGAMAGADPVATGAIPGPSPEQLQAASSIPPSQQDAMVKGMVDRLEGKLKADPANVDGWIMLMRSRMTLGETARASAARDAAIRANPGAASRIRSAASTLGVPGS
jgi:cytochrome c-type biogenesis protein CcmH